MNENENDSNLGLVVEERNERNEKRKPFIKPEKTMRISKEYISPLSFLQCRERHGKKVSSNHAIEKHIVEKWETIDTWERNTERGYITTMSLDKDGVLLAVGSSHGDIDVYDMDDYFHTLHTRRNSLHKKKSLQPILHVPGKYHLPRAITCIQWNPIAPDEIVVGFAMHSNVVVLDLTKPVDQAVTLRPTGPPSSGYYQLKWIQIPTKNKGTNTPKSRAVTGPKSKATPSLHSGAATGPMAAPASIYLLGSATDGCVRLWRRSGKRTFVLEWKYRSKISWSALCYSKQEQIVYGGDLNGTITALHVMKSTIQPFRREKTPTLAWTYPLSSHMNVHEQTSDLGIDVIRHHPRSPFQFLLQLKNQWIVLFDYRIQQILKIRKKFEVYNPSPVIRETLYAAPQISKWKSNRCTGQYLFNGSFWVDAGRNLQEPFLHLVDLTSQTSTPFPTCSIPSLTQMALPVPSIVTSLEYHPNLHLIICGSSSNEILVIGEGMPGNEKVEVSLMGAPVNQESA